MPKFYVFLWIIEEITELDNTQLSFSYDCPTR